MTKEDKKLLKIFLGACAFILTAFILLVGVVDNAHKKPLQYCDADFCYKNGFKINSNGDYIHD